MGHTAQPPNNIVVHGRLKSGLIYMDRGLRSVYVRLAIESIGLAQGRSGRLVGGGIQRLGMSEARGSPIPRFVPSKDMRTPQNMFARAYATSKRISGIFLHSFRRSPCVLNRNRLGHDHNGPLLFLTFRVSVDATNVSQVKPLQAHIKKSFRGWRMMPQGLARTLRSNKASRLWFEKDWRTAARGRSQDIQTEKLKTANGEESRHHSYTIPALMHARQ